jgi:hypothetical protein
LLNIKVQRVYWLESVSATSCPTKGDGVDWNKVAEALFTSSPLAGVLGTVSYKLWNKLEEKDKLIASKDAEIAALNEKRVQDMLRIAKLKD